MRCPSGMRCSSGGNDYGITPCGILAMDMARVEAGTLHARRRLHRGHPRVDPAQKSSPYEMGLGWTVALDKPGYFVGRRALEREAPRGLGLEDGRPRGGLGRSRAPLRRRRACRRRSRPWRCAPACRCCKDGRQVGYASTSTWSPVLKKYIALAHLQRPHYEPGTRVEHGDHRRASPPARAGDRGRAAVLRPRVEAQVTAAPLRRDRHRRGPQRPGRRGLPRARRQEGAGARAPRHRRRRRGDRGDLPRLPVHRVLVRGEPAAARDHPRPRAAEARPQDPAAALAPSRRSTTATTSPPGTTTT